MRNERLLSEIPFEKRILKQSVNLAKKEFLNAYRNDSETRFQAFISKDNLESAIEQPFNVTELLTSSEDIFVKYELHPLQKRLTKIQQTFESNLRTIIGGSQPGFEPTDVSVLAETPQYYIFYDKFELLKESLEPEYEITYTVRTAHRLQAKQMLDQLQYDVPSTDSLIWIVEKPRNWYNGQWALMQTLSHFIQCGMSPTEALDYYMVEIVNSPVRYWAHIRGKSKDAIYNQLRKAGKKVDKHSTPQTSSGYKFSERTYRSETVDKDLEYITVDNGHLHPRRDIINPSLSGKMTSGSNSAGSKQLAVALLADLFDDETATQFANDLKGQVPKLAKSDEDGEWTLSEKQLNQWYWSR